MIRNERDQLRTLLLRQAKAASDEALRTDGQLPTEEVARLEHLARLVEISEAAQSPPPRKRWPVIALLGITLLIVSVLLFARVPETEIELDLTLSETSFVLPRQQVLTGVINLIALGVSGLREVRLPRGHDRVPQTLSDEGDIAFRLSAASDEVRRGTLSLAPLVLPAGTRVWIRYTEVPHQFRLSFEGSSQRLQVDINGPVRISDDEPLDFGIPRPVHLQAGSDTIEVDLSLPGPAAFAPQLAATDLSFFQIDEFTEPHRTLVRRLSTVLTGTLYLESLNGQEHRLRPGEGLRLEGVRGEIRMLRLHEDHITLNFRGHVHGMEIGSGEIRRSLMPTYLQWLQARHGISLLWGTTLYLFGLAAGLLRWWGVRI